MEFILAVWDTQTFSCTEKLVARQETCKECRVGKLWLPILWGDLDESNSLNILSLFRSYELPAVPAVQVNGWSGKTCLVSSSSNVRPSFLEKPLYSQCTVSCLQPKCEFPGGSSSNQWVSGRRGRITRWSVSGPPAITHPQQTRHHFQGIKCYLDWELVVCNSRSSGSICKTVGCLT